MTNSTVEVPLEDQVRALRTIENVLRAALSEIRDVAKRRMALAERNGWKASGYAEISAMAIDSLEHRQGIVRKLKQQFAEERGVGLEGFGVQP